MKTGKIPESVLKRSVLRQLHNRRDEVLLGAGVGEDCAALTLEADEVFVMSTDPITGTGKEMGSLAVITTANDLASSGAEPVGVMLTILLPESSEEALLKEIMRDAEATCEKFHMQILGGHTEVSAAVNRPVISVSGVGKVKKDDKDGRSKTGDGYRGIKMDRHRRNRDPRERAGEGTARTLRYNLYRPGKGSGCLYLRAFGGRSRRKVWR